MPGEFYIEHKAAKVDELEAKLDGLGILVSTLVTNYGGDTLTDIYNALKLTLGENHYLVQFLKTVMDAKEDADIEEPTSTAPVEGSTTADWQAAEADVVSIGAADTKYKLHDLTLSIHNLAGNAITIRMYKPVNGTERLCYQQTFDAGVDGPGLPVVNGTWGIHDVLRVTLQSNNAADNGQAVDYDYTPEAY